MEIKHVVVSDAVDEERLSEIIKLENSKESNNPNLSQIFT